MNQLMFSASLTSLLTFILGLFVFLTDPRNKLNQIFTSYSWSISLWSLCFTQLHMVPAPWGVYYGRLLHLGCTFIPALFFHFAVSLSGTFGRKKLQVVTAYAIATAYNLLNLFPGLFTGEIVYRSGYAYPRPIGLIYFSYFIFFVVVVFYGLVTLWRVLPVLPRYQAKGLRLFILVTSLGYLGGMNNFLIMIDVRLFPLFPYGLYAVVLYSLVASYVVSKCSLLRLQPGKSPKTAPPITSSSKSSTPLEIDALVQ